jgi:hypothetical protein
VNVVHRKVAEIFAYERFEPSVELFRDIVRRIDLRLLGGTRLIIAGAAYLCMPRLQRIVSERQLAC